MSETIGQFIERAWNDHADDTVGVAARMPLARALLEAAPDKAGDFAALAEHVFIEHLGDAQAMAAWFEVLAPMVKADADAQALLDRARLATALLRGDEGGPTGLPVRAVLRAHAAAAGGHAMNGRPDTARALMHQAAALARSAAPDELPAAGKALAASYNNLASLLLDQPRGDAMRDGLMIEWAQLAREEWGRVGNWMNAERADYLLAVCHAALGQGDAALRHAAACLDACVANEADAFERFFAHEAMARASAAARDDAGAAEHQARMQALLAEVDDEGNRAYAATVLVKLA